MKKTLKVSLLALFISNGAFATQYALNSEYLAVSFNDANSAMVLKDVKSQHQLSPEELFFSLFRMKQSFTLLTLK